MPGRTSEGCVVVLPWYHESDFQQLQPTRPDAWVALSYENWRRAASSEVYRQLASGHAVEIVSVRPERYRAWIAKRGLADNGDARLRYIAALSAGA